MQTINMPTLQDINVLRNATSIDTCQYLKQLRDEAQNNYIQIHHPKIKDEDWRFISMPHISWDTLKLANAYIPKIELNNGVFICDMQDFAGVNTYRSKNIFSTFINSSWNRGYVVYVPKNIVIDDPIDLNNLLPAYNADALIEKVVIIIESGAQVTIKDRTCSTQIKSQTIMRSIDIVMQNNAHLTFIHDQDWDTSVENISTIHCTLERNSQLNYNTLITGGAFTKQWITIDLHEQGAQAYMKGAYILQSEQQFAINAVQHHRAPHTQSNLVFKGIITDAAHALYQGTIFIDKNAHDSDASQNNKNILLGEKARAYSIPNLQVLNNDVQCAHGSAVGQLDAEQLFYARSRGLSESQAQKMLLTGFLQDLFYDSHISVSDRLKNLYIK